MRTTPGSGAILKPYFNSNYGVTSIQVLNGGAGYATTDPPKIVIENTEVPITQGQFFPIIVNGSIANIKIISSGSGYIPLSTSITATGVAVLDSEGSISQINIIDAGIGYTTPPTVTISNPSLIGSGTFITNEKVIGQTSNTEAKVKSWNSQNSTLQLSSITGEFSLGEIVIGEISGALYKIRNLNTNNTQDAFAQNEEIEIESDLIIDFSESNPFGMP